MDVPSIIAMAKEQLLEDKEYSPTFFVETVQGVTMIALDFLPDTTLEKAKLFFSIGRRVGSEAKEDLLIQQIVFIVEAWVTTQPLNEPRKYSRPSLDPNRKEMLIIQVLDCMPTLRQSLHRVEMLRDGSGDLVDLLHIDTLGDVQSTLLTSFLAGHTSAKMSDSKLAALVAKYRG